MLDIPTWMLTNLNVDFRAYRPDPDLLLAQEDDSDVMIGEDSDDIDPGS